MTRKPRVVAIGGGHGTAVSLRAIRRYADEIIAVVSVADDGGSSGRLRELLGVPALGDLRKCLVALAEEGSSLAEAMEHRFEAGELAGHALGNLILAGLIESQGDFVRGIAEAGRLLGAVGTVLPATAEAVALRARGGEGVTVGQVAIGRASAISSVSIVPDNAEPPLEVLDAIAAADQIVIGPGSLYTSVLAAASVPVIAEAIQSAAAQRIFVCNLRSQIPESDGYSVADHVDALARHDLVIDVVVCESSDTLEVGATQVPVIDVSLTGSNALVHDPVKLSDVLSGLWTQRQLGNKETT